MAWEVVNEAVTPHEDVVVSRRIASHELKHRRKHRVRTSYYRTEETPIGGNDYCYEQITHDFEDKDEAMRWYTDEVMRVGAKEVGV